MKMRLKQFYNQMIVCLMMVCFFNETIAQHAENIKSIHGEIQNVTDEIYDELVQIRRDFHKYPEVSNDEKRTSEKIASYLKNLGLEVKSGVGGYGVIGILKGDQDGRKVAWRADIDAMPSEVPENLEYASVNEGIRHICGHDINTTIGLGIARVLSSQKAALKGTVYFVFQPAEETYTGAKAMVDDGLFDLIHPEEIYASHIAPLPSNMISTRPEWLFSDYKTVRIRLKRSAQDESAVEFSKQLLSSLQTVDPGSAFFNPMSQMDPNIGLANPNSIFKDFIIVQNDFVVDKLKAHIDIMIRLSASNKRLMNSVIPKLQDQMEDSEFASLLKEIKFINERANVFNNPALTEESIISISSIYGSQTVVRLYGAISDGRGDDFAYFQTKVPGVYFLLGGSNYEKGIISMPHSPNFTVDESCIKTGVNYFSSLLVERLHVD